MCNWVPASNLHLTLRFLGNVTESQLEHINTTLTEKLDNVSTFLTRFKNRVCSPIFANLKWLLFLFRTMIH